MNFVPGFLFGIAAIIIFVEPIFKTHFSTSIAK